MRRVSIVLALVGVAVTAALVLRFDAGDVWRAMLSVGWDGAAILLLCQGVLFLVLGAAWSTVQPAISAPVLIWGRMVRDAATSCLPFSPLGGYVISARAVALCGPDWTSAAAGTVVDASVEFAGELLFVLAGAVALLALQPDTQFALPVGAGVCAVLLVGGVAFSQRGRIGTAVQALGMRLFGHYPQFRDNLHRTSEVMADLYGRPGRLLVGTALHLFGWFATGMVTWVSLRLLGQTPSLLGVVTLEALLSAALSLAFVVPGAAGVQEAGYLGLGAVLGVPPDIALSLSLLRRAREVGWGLPILGIWQWQEVRRA